MPIGKKAVNFDSGSKLATWRPCAEMVVDYCLVPMNRFTTHLAKVWNNPRSLNDIQRVEAIKQLVIDGAVILPVWIDFRLISDDPIEVAEGNHRLRAFAELGLEWIPVFVCKHNFTA